MFALYARSRTALIAAALVLSLNGMSPAAISTTGDVTPTPSPTGSGNNLYVGKEADGTMLIDGGGYVASDYSYVGYSEGVTGAATIDGASSTWTTTGNLYLGRSGTGSLAVTNGGSVDSLEAAYLGYAPGASGLATITGANSTWNVDRLTVGYQGTGSLDIADGGLVHVTGETTVTHPTGSITFDGGTLSTGGLKTAPDAITGVGTINTHGLCSDIDLVFDDSHALQQQLAFADGPDQNVTISLDVDGSGDLGAGFAGQAALTITDGVTVASRTGYLGYLAGSCGTATVAGDGSTWANSSSLSVGLLGSASLAVTGGAAVSSSKGSIGAGAGETGVVTVDGTGSIWTSSSLFVGASSTTLADGQPIEAGAGTLNISGGGLVEVSRRTCVGASGEQGTIHLDGGTLNTADLQAAPYQFTGNGTVNTHGLVSDADLRFDQSHGLQQQLIWDSQPGQHVTVNLDVTGSSILGAGFEEAGSLTIAEGVTVSSWLGQLGYQAGSSGTAVVDGPGSTWNLTYALTVGEFGEGMLSISNGGTVNSGSNAYIGYRIGSSGTVIVEGSGSSWTNGLTYVGRDGDGTLIIRDGASMDCQIVRIAAEDGSSGSLTVTGENATLNATYGVSVGKNNGGGSTSGVGTLAVTAGGHVTGGGGSIDFGSDAIIQGVGSSWSTPYIDNSGAVTVSGGARLESTEARLWHYDDASSVLTVDGPGSTWVNAEDVYLVPGWVGMVDPSPGAASVLTITGGGHVSSHAVLMGDRPPASSLPTISPGALAVVNVDGADSALAVGDELHVGGRISAQLTISGGGQVANSDAWVGYEPSDFPTTSHVTVTGKGSTWTSSGVLTVGTGNQGAVEIADGATVSSGAAYIGYNSDGTGVVTIDGDGSIWTVNSFLVVGNHGAGTLNILGGTVDVGTVLHLAYLDGSTGTVNLSGGVLRMNGVASTISSYHDATFNFTGGRLEGATTIDLRAPLVQHGGTLAPGNSTGATLIEDGYTLEGGTIEIEINGLGTAGTDWDLVQVNGTVDLVGDNGLLDGVLSVILGFAPTPGDTFLVLENDDADPIVGMFATGTSARAAYDGRLYQFAINYAAGDGNDIALVAQDVVGLVGDYSGDGVVDAADYSVWQDMLGAHVAPYFGADGNGNGVVDEADYDVWKSRFGAALSDGALAGATIPEPSTLLLLGAWAAFVPWLCRRRRGH